MAVAANTVQFKIKGQQLKDIDFFSKSDPICLVEEYMQDDNTWRVIGQTEKIDNNLNPEFQTQPEFNYSQVSQRVKFGFWDFDADSQYQLIGLADATIDELLQAQANGQPWTGRLTHPDKPHEMDRGSVIVTVSCVN